MDNRIKILDTFPKKVIPTLKTINKLLAQRWKFIRSKDLTYYNQIAAYHYQKMKTLPMLTLRKITN